MSLQLPQRSSAWTVFGAVYSGAVFLLGAGAAVRILSNFEEPEWVSATLLVLMAAATASFKIRLPGNDQGVSLSLLFTFAAVADGIPSVALMVAAISVVFDALAGPESAGSKSENGFNLAGSALSILGTSEIHLHLIEVNGLPGLAATAIAAMAYYASVTSITAVRIAISGRDSLWRVWNEKFLWTGLIFMLAPVGVIITRLMLGASGPWVSILSLGLILSGFSYLKICFGRLHDERHHTHELDEIRQRAIETLAAAIEAKDGGTAGHLKRVKRHAVRLAESFECTQKEIRTLESAAVLHDVGKVGVPDFILKKPDRLTEQEFQQVTRHAAIGATLVSAMRFPEPVDEVVLSHHEHWDGSGYPRGLSGQQIPRLARILTVVDCFDALVSDRPYRLGLSIDEAVEIMTGQRGKIFDPAVLDLFLDQLDSHREDLEEEIETESRSRKLIDRSNLRLISQTWMDKTSRREVSPRRKILERVLASPDLVMAIFNVLEGLGVGLEFEKGLRESLGILKKIVGCEKIGVFVREQDHYVLVQSAGLPDHSHKRVTLPLRQGPLAQVAMCKMPITVESPVLGSGAPVLPYSKDVKSVLAAPLTVDDELIGMIVLGSSRDAAFNEDEALILSLVTRKLASTLLSNRAMTKVFHEAKTDAATDLPNARAALEALDAEIARAQRESKSVGVLFMDINGLKQVNDTHGHAAGDKLLLATAQKLRESVRLYDFVGRVGGDEFLAVLPGMPQSALEGMVSLLKKSVSESYVKLADGLWAQTSLSIGAAVFPTDGDTAEELVKLADQRMYQDKQRTKPAAPPLHARTTDHTMVV